MDWTRRHAIGHGSTATVSLATTIPSGDVFAVKSTHLSKSEFLQKEQKILSSLNSPHIVSYKGCDITSENCQLFYNLFMEYAPGGSLADMIHRHAGRLDESMIASYTRQILQGLEYLHSSGLVHCDIKGRNILIGEDGAKIADFGCAKWEAEERQSGGTPMFMAPEVARGEHQGVSSDIWALGCTVIEMASGGVPWPDATDPVSVLYRIAYSCELPEFPGFLSNQAKDFLSKCLRRDPKERWTATQLLKHPFLREFSSSTKQIQASNSISNSPTSILDQDIWNSVEESLGNLIHASSQSSVSERIRRLTCSDGPSWNWDERWMTIRGNNEENNAIMNDIEGKDDMICGSVLDSFCGSLEEQESYVNGGKLLDFLNDTISFRKISRFCTYKNDCVVISSNLNFQRDTDSLLIPSIKGRISNEYTENYTHAVFKRFQRKEDLVKFYGNSFYLKVVKEHVTLYCHGMINVDFESEVEDDILPIFVKERVQRWCRVCASNQQQLLRVHLVDLQKRHWHHLKN